MIRIITKFILTFKLEKLLKFLFIVVSLVVGISIVVVNISNFGEQQFVFLAKSFLNGNLFFMEEPGSWNDVVLFNSRYYWPLGPLPAFILLPFVAIAGNLQWTMPQGYFQIMLIAGTIIVLFKLVKLFNYTTPDSLFIVLSFIAGSAYIGVALIPWSWYFSQVVTVLLLFLVLYEFLTRKRTLLVGVLCGLLLLTRVTASFVIVFFILATVTEKHTLLLRVKNVFRLTFPYIIFLLVFCLYNYARFGNAFEQGYSMQIIPNAANTAREYGIISLVHLPGNLFYLFLSSVEPVFKDSLSHVLTFPYVKANQWGMSMFLTSPILISLFWFTYKDKLSKLILITVIIIALPILFYYGIGWRQFGYRYSLDFLPLLYLLLMVGYKAKHTKLTPRFKMVVIVSSLFNLYLVATTFLISL